MGSLQDSDTETVRRAFSAAPTDIRPAPVIWSSRLEVRWTARWQGNPRFVV
jgi:hypothetical protein